MAVSKRDRDYMDRIGRYKMASHAEAAARHRALPIAARLQRSWALFLAHRGATRRAAGDDDATRFYERARARGLYRP